MDQFMKRAVELALHNVESGGQPFGAVLVKDDKIVAEGVNELHLKCDVSGHAELIAIRKVQEEEKTLDLSEYTMYASGEPCPMCMGAIYFSRIQKVVYCGSIEDAKAAELGTSAFIYKQLALPREQRTIEMIQMPIKPGMDNPLEKWKSAINN